AASFYNVIDVKFDGDAPVIPEWTQGGQIIPTMNLKVGDSVYTRVFDQSGENVAYRTELAISNDALTQAKNWSYALASKINQEQTKLQAGQYSEDKFTPVYGTNPIYLQSNSGLERVEIGYNIETPVPDYSLTVDGLASEYIIATEPTALDLTLTAEGDLTAELTVYNHHREPLASWTGAIQDGGSEQVELTLSKSEPG
ncbi:N-acetylglucosamine-binding protein GbpA, partial [Vibrio sp. 1866]|nr:N-acetylglucosamine-binding protein GbpA [Vibrio sp. 1866]